MAVTANGITYPDDPNAFADMIAILTQLATDVDSKFVPKVGTTMSGALASTQFIATTGSNTQASIVFRTAPSGGYDFYDDALRIDGSFGRRLWISGPNASDVQIAARSGTFNRARVIATNIDLNGAVNITGTLNVTGQASVRRDYGADYALASTSTSAPYPWIRMTGANAGFTFVAPASGSVTIGLGGILPAYSKQVAISYQVRAGATVGAGTVVMAYKSADAAEPPYQAIAMDGAAATGGQFVTLYNAWFLRGLTKGSTYNIESFYRNFNIPLTLRRMYYLVTPDI